MKIGFVGCGAIGIHTAEIAKGSRARIMDTTVENVKAWLDGAPQNVVNQ